MSVLIKGMKMPKDGCRDCIFVNRKWHGDVCPILKREVTGNVERGGFQTDCPLVEVPPHGDLIDRDALIKDGWSNLHKEVMRMGGYAIHELPLKNPSIHVIIPAEEETDDSPICTKASLASRGIYKAEEDK